MTLLDVLHQRLHNQRLIGELFASPQAAVQALGAVQAQDYTGAKWAVGQRTHNCTDADVSKAFNDGQILRTHILRPTWHFVAADDIRWMHIATAPRVHALNAYYYRKLGLDDAVLKKTTAILTKALQGGIYLTRVELQGVMERAGITSASLGIGYVLIHAELEALICSGPMKGKQHTYALVSERAPHAKPLPRDEAIAKLTERYFTSHGPALVQDFAWWSSLSMADVKAGLNAVQSKLQNATIDGKTYWFAASAAPKIPEPLVHLLPNYDEYLVAYKDRPAFFDASQLHTFGSRDMVFANHILTLDGRLLGGWRRISLKNSVEIQANYVRALTAEQAKALQQAVDRFEAFVGKNVQLTKK